MMRASLFIGREFSFQFAIVTAVINACKYRAKMLAHVVVVTFLFRRVSNIVRIMYGNYLFLFLFFFLHFQFDITLIILIAIYYLRTVLRFISGMEAG